MKLKTPMPEKVEENCDFVDAINQLIDRVAELSKIVKIPDAPFGFEPKHPNRLPDTPNERTVIR
jgi:hypothetical protein